MAKNDGLDAILSIDSQILDQIKAVEKGIQGVAAATEEMTTKMLDAHNAVMNTVTAMQDMMGGSGINVNLDTKGLAADIAEALNMVGGFAHDAMQKVDQQVEEETKKIEDKKKRTRATPVSEVEMKRQIDLMNQYFASYAKFTENAYWEGQSAKAYATPWDDRINKLEQQHLEQQKMNEQAAQRNLEHVAQMIQANKNLTKTEEYLAQAESVRLAINEKLKAAKKASKGKGADETTSALDEMKKTLAELTADGGWEKYVAKLQSAQMKLVEMAKKGNLSMTMKELDDYIKQRMNNAYTSYQQTIDSLREAIDRLSASQEHSDEQFKAHIATLDGSSASMQESKEILSQMSDYYKEMEKGASAEAAMKTAGQKATDSLRATLENIKNLDDSTLGHLKDKISQMKSLYHKLIKDVAKNPLIPPSMVDECLAELDALEAKLENMKRDDKIEAGQGKLQAALGLREDSFQDIKKKLAEVEKAYKKLKDDAGDAFNSIDVSDALEEMDRLREKMAEVSFGARECEEGAQFLKESFRHLVPTFAVSKFIGDLVQIRGEFELAEKSIAVIVGDADKAATIFKDLSNIAVKSPFQLSDLVKQTKQLAAYRIETDKLVETNKMLGDISAGVGVDMNRLILAYGQVKAATVLKGTELRQFSEAGVNMLGGLADRFTELNGRIVTTGEVLKMVSKKMVSFEDVDAVLRAQTAAGGTFYKMQEQQAETVSGMISNLKDRMDLMYNDIGKSTEGLIKGIIKMIEGAIANYEAFLGVISSVVVYKSVVGLFGMLIKQMKSFRLVAAEMGMVKLAAQFNSLHLALQGMLTTLPVIAGVLAVIAGLGITIERLTRAQREYNKIAKEASEEVADQQARYQQLKGIIESNTASLNSRIEAFEKLKEEFGHILPLEKENIDTINLSSEAYEDATHAIARYGAQRALERMHAKAIADLEAKRGDTLRKLTDAMNAFKKSSEYTRQELGNLYYIDQNDIAEAMAVVEEKIKSGALKTNDEILSEFYKTIAAMFNVSEEFVNNLFGANGGERKLKRQFDKLLQPFEDALDAENKYNLETYGEQGTKVLERIKSLESDYNSVLNDIQNKQDAMGAALDPYKAEVLAQEWLNAQVSAIEGLIADLGDTANPDLKDKLTSVVTSIKLPSLDKEILDAVGNALAKHSALLKNKEFMGNIRRGDNDDIDTWIANIQKSMDQVKAIVDQYESYAEGAAREAEKQRLFAITGKWIEEYQDELAAYGDLIEALKYYQTLNKDLTSPKKTRESYQSDLKSFVSAVRSAVKEFDDLNAEGDAMLIRRLQILGKKVKIDVPDNFQDINIDEWLKGIEKKLDEDARLEIQLAVNKEKTEDAINEVKEQLEQLWERYDTAKKAQELGITLKGMDTSSVYSDIMKLEQQLINFQTKSSTDAANDNAKKRLKIVSDEQEEAMKIIYESNKKALTKSQQLYQDMYEDIGKMTSLFNKDGGINAEDGTVQQGIIARMEKGFKDIADAEWEAYKSTEMYIAAFGDLDGLSNDVIRTLKDNLEGWSLSEALSPAEARRVQNALDKMREKLEEQPTGGLLSAMQSTFSTMKNANEIRKTTIPALEEALKIATKYQNAAKEAMDKSEEAAIVKATAVADAQSAYNKAEKAWRESLESGDQDEINKRRAEMDAAMEAQTQALLDMEDAKVDATTAEENYSAAMEHTSNVMGELTDAQKKFKAMLEQSDARVTLLKDSYDSFGDAISSVIDLVNEIGEAFGVSLSDEAADALEAFQKGFGLVSQGMTTFLSLTAAAKAALKALEIEGAATMSVLWPLLAVGAALGVTAAAVKIADNKKVKQIEKLKNEVDELAKSFDDLQDAMERASNLTAMKKNYDDAIANIKRQQEALLEAIALENARGAKKDDEAIKGYQDQIAELKKQAAELREDTLSAMGMDDAASMAEDWASAWLDAYEETGDGLDALEDNFDDFLNKLIMKQISKRVMGKYTDGLVDLLDKALDGDFAIDEAEAAEIRAYKEVLKRASEESRALAEELGASSGREGAGDTLQKGVQTITETTGSAIQAYLDSIRYYVFDSNTLWHEIRNFLFGDGAADNPVLLELKAQTALLRSMDTLLSSVSRSGHTRGGYGIKVFMD